MREVLSLTSYEETEKLETLPRATGLARGVRCERCEVRDLGIQALLGYAFNAGPVLLFT